MTAFGSQSVWLRCGIVTLLRLHVLRYFLNETMALRESPTDGLEEASVSLSAFRLDSRISTGGRWRRGGEPEPNEESKRLRSDNQVTLKTYNLWFLKQAERSNHVEFIGCCNELNAAYAADGFARLRGLSALVTTYSVGELSAIAGVAGPMLNGFPSSVSSARRH
jgi:Thiamine pyrophosphate enzyme, N-terminal TPP binding domain